MKEIWTDVKGFKGLLKISTYGNIVVKERYCLNNGTKVKHKERVGKAQKTRAGYLQFSISIEGKVYRKYLHVMVAESFLGDLRANSLEVNHINGDKSDNNLRNLEWVTSKENTQHALINGLMKDRKGNVMKKIEDIKCKHCGVVFKPQSKDSKYCSRSCSSSSPRLHSRRVVRPDKMELYELLKIHNFTTVGVMFGVTANAIRKWCLVYEIPHKSAYYRNISKTG